MGNNASAGADGGTALLTVTAGAPANSIFVSSAGRVGFGTSTPVLDLHRRSGNTPALRLEQDGSSGFAPQTWDIAGNETSFFVRDATNGSTLPFRILPGAPSNSITIVAGGNVGVGTVSPTASMHVRRTNGTAQLFVEEAGASSGQRQLLRLTNNGNALINLTNSSNNNEWLLGGGANMTIRHGTTDTLVFSLAPTGELRIPQLVSCAGLQTNASGVVSCAAGPTPPRSASDIPYAMARAGTSTLATSASLVGSTGAGTPGSPSSGPSSTASNGTSETCAPGDMVGRWKLIATNIAKFGANSVLWCDVQLTQAQVRSESRYSISGNCRSHLPDESTPEKFSVDGKGSITEMATCTMGGSFRIKQGSAVVATANILEGWIEGPVGKKTRAVALSRMPHGRTSTIQTFVLQR
jgi:hypothetical protein